MDSKSREAGERALSYYELLVTKGLSSLVAITLAALLIESAKKAAPEDRREWIESRFEAVRRIAVETLLSDDPSLDRLMSPGGDA